ncbi:MAG: hypothetical protein SGPRY_008268 [Prymnesium sp.]
MKREVGAAAHSRGGLPGWRAGQRRADGRAVWSRKTLEETPNWECIILGALGGEFRSGARAAKVQGVVANGTGVRKLIVARENGARRTTEMALQDFLKEFHPARVREPEEGLELRGAEESGGGQVDFKELPCFLTDDPAVRRPAGKSSVILGLGADARVPFSSSWRPSVAGATRARAVAFRLEGDLEAAQLSVLDKVKKAFRFCGGENLRPGDKGSVLKELLATPVRGRGRQAMENERKG